MPVGIVVNLNCVELVTSIVYLPDKTAPVLTSTNTLLSVDSPWAELQVTVTVDPYLEYVEDIPESLSTIRSAILSPARKATSVGKDLSFTLTNLQRVSLNSVELW